MTSAGFATMVVCAIALGIAVAVAPWTTVGLAAVGLTLLVLFLGNGLAPSVGVIVCVFVAVGGDQLVATARTGGAGVLPVGGAVIAVVALLVARRIGVRRLGDALRANGTPALLWLGVGVVLPLLAVLVGFPPRTVASIVTPVGAIGALAIGAAAQYGGTSVPQMIRKMLVPLLWVLALLGVAQVLSTGGVAVPGSQPLIAFLQDRTEAVGRTVVYGRATGLYMNPNTLSLMGGLALIFLIGDRSSPWTSRVLGAVPAVIILAVGQSRAAVLSCAVAIVAQLVVDLSPYRFGRHPVVRALVPVAFVIAVMWVLAPLIAPSIVGGLVSRINSLLDVRLAGVGVDTSVSGRLLFWSAGLSEAVGHPLGTWGPPQLVVTAGLDNEYLYTLLQGGILYLAAELWMFVDAWRLGLKRSSAVSVGLVSYVVLVGLSQSVAGMVPITLFWLLLGATFVSVGPVTTASAWSEVSETDVRLGTEGIEGSPGLSSWRQT